MKTISWIRKLTSKELIFQAAPGHVFIYQKPVFFFATVSDQLHQMCMS